MPGPPDRPVPDPAIPVCPAPVCPTPDSTIPDSPIPDSPISDSPIIVIFGAAVRPDGRPSGALRERIDAAARCGADRPASIFIPTGARGRHGPSEAVVMRNRLLAHGIPADRIILEDTGTDTLSSVRAVRRLLAERGLGGPVHVATSAYHQPRCVILCRLAGLRARACPSAGADRPSWQSVLGRWYWYLREVPALPYDVLALLGLRLLRRL